MHCREIVRSIFIISLILTVTSGHPMCLDFTSPQSHSEKFALCTDFEEYGCCTKARDGELYETYTAMLNLSNADSNSTCAMFTKNLLCQECSEYAAHQFSLERNGVASTFPGLCPGYCDEHYKKCRHALLVVAMEMGDEDMSEVLRSSDSKAFCERVKLSDFDYCFPAIEDSRYLHRNLDFYEVSNQKPCMQLCAEEVANKMYSASSIRNAGDGSHRLFVVEQRGVIWAFLPNMSKIHPPFLNITKSVACYVNNYDERGLLDIQFHPGHRSNGLFYVYYTAIRGDEDIIRISEMKVMSIDVNFGDPSTERILLELVQPYHNHNGGQLLFGKDGYLYIFTGDGGGAGDVAGNAQNRSSLLGKVLRIDVDSNRTSDLPYVIPPDNPFVSNEDFAPEIFAYGLRNPWRCTVDPEERIICGDVGQELWEEVDIIKKGGNYGWRAMEGDDCYDEEICEKVSHLDDYIPPIFSYNNSLGKSITGGHVYRGCKHPKLKGKYIFGDFMSGKMMLLSEHNDGSWSSENVCMSKKVCGRQGKTHKYSRHISSYGEDEAGELYFASTKYPRVGYGGGRIYKLSQAYHSKRRPPCQPSEVVSVFMSEGTVLSNHKPSKGEDLKLRLVGANEVRIATKGRVEIKHGRKGWSTVCGETWDLNDGHVVCRMLGFALARNVSTGAFGPGRGHARLKTLDCKGSEEHLAECDHSGWNYTRCPHAKDASVWCETWLFS